MSAPRKIKKVEVVYEDGTVESFDAPGGFYRTHQNNVTRDMDLSRQWIEHEIRWSERNVPKT